MCDGHGVHCSAGGQGGGHVAPAEEALVAPKLVIRAHSGRTTPIAVRQPGARVAPWKMALPAACWLSTST